MGHGEDVCRENGGDGMNSAVIALNSMPLRDTDQWMRDDASYWDLIMMQTSCYPAVVLPSADCPVVVCGVVFEAGRGEMWMVVGQGLCGRVAGIVLRQQRSLILTAVAALDLSSLCMALRPDRHDAKRWARALGFEFCEFCAAGSFDGSDIEVWNYPIMKGK